MSSYQQLYVLSFVTFLIMICFSCGKLEEEYKRNAMLAEIALSEDRRLIDPTNATDWALSPDSVVRERLAYTIGIVGDTAYLHHLNTLLEDSCRSVVLQAIFTVGQLGDSSLTMRIINHSRSEDSEIKRYAITALSKIGTQSAVQRLIDVLRDERENDQIRAHTAQAMCRLKDKNSLKLLINLARIENNQVRQGIYYSLFRRAVPEMQRVFRIGLRDTLEQIQIYSVIGSGRVCDSSAVERQGPALTERIAPLLKKRNWRLKYHSLNTIGRLKLKTLIKAVTNLLAEEEHIYIRQAAIRTLGKLESTGVTSRLTRFLNDKNPNMRGEALVALAKIKGKQLLEEIEPFAASDNHLLRIAAANAYAVIGNEDVVEKLELMFADIVPVVRAEVIEKLFALGIDSLMHKHVELGLTDEDMVPFTLACEKAGKEKMEWVLPIICERFNHSTGESGFEIKITILDALAEYGDSLTVTNQIADMIKSALTDQYFPVRKRAAQVAAALDLPSEFNRKYYHSEISAKNFSSIYERYDTNPKAIIKTAKGKIEIELFYNAAPKTVNNFITLAKNGFYDQGVWHRVIPDFVIQDGCPRGDGWGSPGYEIRCEYNDLPYIKGSVGMATSGKDTGGSQYFICQSAQSHLDGRYTLFGQVIEGINTVTLMEIGDSIYSIVIVESEEN